MCALQRALMQHPNSHCWCLPPAAPAAPRAPRRGRWDPHHPPPPVPSGPAEPPPGRPRQVPGSSRPARGRRAQGHAGINKAKPRAALLWGYFCGFSPISVFFHLVQGKGAGGGGPYRSAAASCSPAPPPPLIAWGGWSGERERESWCIWGGEVRGGGSTARAGGSPLLPELGGGRQGCSLRERACRWRGCIWCPCPCVDTGVPAASACAGP